MIDAVEAHTCGLADRLRPRCGSCAWTASRPEDAERAVAAFLAAETCEVERRTKNGMRTFDARAAVARLEAAGRGPIGPTAMPVRYCGWLFGI